ncbi:exported hypothetical protein [Xanthomonas citri pv. fuscans]|nr:exported hypothetical protein [Xanthomonas citri pv. fuscans]
MLACTSPPDCALLACYALAYVWLHPAFAHHVLREI